MLQVDLAQLLHSAVQFLPRLLSALVVFCLGLVLSRLLARWLIKWTAKRLPQAEIARLVTRLGSWTLFVAFAIAALDQVNFDVTAFLAGLGVVSLTIGLALQDIARNFVAGIILLVRRPFQVGDAVKLGEFSGQVIDVNTRDTTIATWNGERVIVPNLKVLEAPIANFSVAPRLLRTVKIGLGYGQDIEYARSVLLAAASAVDGVMSDPPATIYAEALGDYAIALTLRYWVDHHTSSVFDVSSSVIVALNRAAQEHDLELPYPIQTVRVTQA